MLREGVGVQAEEGEEGEGGFGVGGGEEEAGGRDGVQAGGCEGDAAFAGRGGGDEVADEGVEGEDCAEVGEVCDGDAG